MHPRRRSPFATALLVLSLLSPGAAVAALDDEPLSLSALLARAMEANPQLQAAQARIAAAHRRPDQAASLPDPMMEFILRNVDFPTWTIGDEMMSGAGVMFSQPLVTGGKRPARRRVAERGIDVAMAQHEAIRRRLIRDVTVLYHDIALVDESLALVADTRLLLQELERTAQSRYAVGAALQQDVLKAQVESSVLLEETLQLEQRRASLAAALNERLDLPADTAVGAPQRQQPPPRLGALADLQLEAANAAPAVIQLHSAIAEQQAAVDLAQVDDSPDIVLGGGWMYRGAMPAMWEFNVGISLPVRKGQRQHLALDEALDGLRAREYELRAGARAVDTAVRDAWLRVERAENLLSLYDEAVLPQADLALESTLSAYRVGNVDFLNVLDATLKLLAYRTEWERQRTEWLVALADIEEQVGRSLGASPPAPWLHPQIETASSMAGQSPASGTSIGGSR